MIIESYATLASCVASMVGTLLIIATYFSSPKKKLTRTLLVWLSIADFVTAFCYLLNVLTCRKCTCVERWKETFALLTMYFPMASFLWTDCIGAYVYGVTYQKKWTRNPKKLLRFFHVLCWGVPFLLILALIILKHGLGLHVNYNGQAGGIWCWISNDNTTDLYFQLVGGKGVEWLSYVFLLAIYLGAYFGVWKIERMNKNILAQSKKLGWHQTTSEADSSKNAYDEKEKPLIPSNYDADYAHQTNHKKPMPDATNKKSSSFRNRLIIVPIIFIAIRLPGSLRNVLLFAKPSWRSNFINKILRLLQTFLDPAQGWSNALLFVVTVSPVKQDLRAMLKKRCCPCGAKTLIIICSLFYNLSCCLCFGLRRIYRCLSRNSNRNESPFNHFRPSNPPLNEDDDNNSINSSLTSRKKTTNDRNGDTDTSSDDSYSDGSF